MIARLVLIVVALAMAPSAHAGWLGAEWGMSVEQVLAATPGQAKAKQSRGHDVGEHRVKAGGIYLWEADAFETSYYFDVGGLSKVALEWKKKPKPADCQRLGQRLVAQYGQPLRTSDQTIIKLLIWHDKPAANRIRLLISSGICTLYYERLGDYEEHDLANPGSEVKPPRATSG